MRIVKKYETQDGKLHDSKEDAKRHVENCMGQIITKLAHEALRKSKYVEMCDFIESSLPEMNRLITLSNDRDLIENDGD